MAGKIVLVGYYGYDNLGDDLMLWCLLNELIFIKPKVEITVLAKPSENLERICKEFSGVKLVPFKSNAKVYNLMVYLKAIFSHELTVWGGGTCFSEEDGIGNFKYFALNAILNKSFAYLGIGIGNLEKARSIRKAKYLLSNATFATFRDSRSLEVARNIYEKGHYHHTADISFLYRYEFSKDINNSEYALVSLRDLSNFYSEEHIADRHASIASFLIELLEHTTIGRLVFLPIDSKKDRITNKMVEEKVKDAIDSQNFTTELVIEQDFRKKTEWIMNSSVNITERLHSMVISEMNKIPCIAISYSPKIDRFYEDDVFGSNYIAHQKRVTKEMLWNVYRNLHSKTEGAKKVDASSLRKKAKKNIQLLMNYLRN